MLTALLLSSSPAPVTLEACTEKHVKALHREVPPQFGRRGGGPLPEQMQSQSLRSRAERSRRPQLGQASDEEVGVVLC